MGSVVHWLIKDAVYSSLVPCVFFSYFQMLHFFKPMFEIILVSWLGGLVQGIKVNIAEFKRA